MKRVSLTGTSRKYWTERFWVLWPTDVVIYRCHQICLCPSFAFDCSHIQMTDYKYSYKQLCVFIFLYILNIGKKTYSQPDAFSDGEICGPAALFGCNSFSFLAWRSTLKENSITILLIVIHSMPTCWTKNNKHIVRRKSILHEKVDEPVLMRYPDTALQFGFSCLSQVQHTIIFVQW